MLPDMLDEGGEVLVLPTRLVNTLLVVAGSTVVMLTADDHVEAVPLVSDIVGLAAWVEGRNVVLDERARLMVVVKVAVMLVPVMLALVEPIVSADIVKDAVVEVVVLVAVPVLVAEVMMVVVFVTPATLVVVSGLAVTTMLLVGVV
mmetsp:Transcript_109165/g.348475  ORF Transcript_109165/g.348475 Transcript_109165/m.348475 type:complete len:146 (+) Transcript_109165:3427-3864(+)